MREAKARDVLVLFREFRHLVNHADQPLPDQQQAVSNLQQLSVVRHKTACRTEVDDGLCVGALFAPCFHVGHHVVSPVLFMNRGAVEVDVVDV